VRTIVRGLGRGALVPAAALAVHQLRFTLAFGGHASAALQQQGHAYLHSLAPWIALTLAAAAGVFLWALGRALNGHRSPTRYVLSFTGLWIACGLTLVAIFAAQELLEGFFATGHPAGLAGVFSYGGWWSIPAAACVGLILAAVFHGARWTLDEIAQRRAHRTPAPRHPNAALPRWLDAALPRLSPLADGASGRGPPA
jgi:hypothetical protein